MAEILLADDERVVREGLKALLVGEGFSVRTARDGVEALARFREKRPDLVILDVMMPKENGFCVCERLRAEDKLVPVIFLTARDGEADQVRGIALGADDYVAKGASKAVFVARVRRALERSHALAAAIDEPVRHRLCFGKVSVDLDALAVYERDVLSERLTRSEADVLAILDAARGRFVTVAELIAALRGEGFVCEDTMLYSHVSRLRRKLGAAADWIVSSRHGGYALVDPSHGANL